MEFFFLPLIQQQVSPIKSQNLLFRSTKTAGIQDNTKTEQCTIMIGCGWVSWYRRGVRGWWWTEPYTHCVHPVSQLGLWVATSASVRSTQLFSTKAINVNRDFTFFSLVQWSFYLDEWRQQSGRLLQALFSPWVNFISTKSVKWLEISQMLLHVLIWGLNIDMCNTIS